MASDALGGTGATATNWANQIRPERDETYNWHFVDIPKDASGFSDSRDCYRPEDTHKGAKDDHQNCPVGPTARETS